MSTAPRSPETQATTASIEEIDAVLPQTQCTRCGYPDCRRYAEAISTGQATINRCPPGGDEGIVRLARLTGQAVLPLDLSCGTEGPRLLAVIDEAWCIGCTLCLEVCPVDCIALVPVSGTHTGWAAWSQPQAIEAQARYQFHQRRMQATESDNQQRLNDKAEAKLADLSAHSQHTDPVVLDRKRDVIEAALARARARQANNNKP